nr:hypothetical protein [Nonomuraea jiangxiensis]
MASDKTIIGIGANAALVGGGLTIGLPVDDITAPPANAVHNIIIRNISFSGATDDMINVQMFSHHVWIDHNDFSNGDDGAVDIKRGSDFVTVSWNRFHDHDKTLLLSHDEDAGPQDTGRLRLTYHHNFFDGTYQRHPRVRFAEPVHVFNNYYRNNALYGVASTENAGVLVEGNYFESVAPRSTSATTRARRGAWWSDATCTSTRAPRKQPVPWSSPAPTTRTRWTTRQPSRPLCRRAREWARSATDLPLRARGHGQWPSHEEAPQARGGPLARPHSARPRRAGARLVPRPPSQAPRGRAHLVSRVGLPYHARP